MAQHNQTGRKGEDLAAQYLLDNGYQILERNWRYGKGEVDIICSNESYLVIAEVKTRSTVLFGEPQEAVDRKKRKYLVSAGDAYVNLKNINLEVRFDIISVIIDEQRHTIRHIEDAFYPTL